MGHYQKKPYKKHSLDPYNDIDIEREYLDALYDDEDYFDDQDEHDSKETALLNEPEIVRQLRQEELEGTLPLHLIDLSEDAMTTMTLSSPLDSIEKRNLQRISPQSYEECFEIAKKTLKNLYE
jgi:hypothetical protein